MRKDKFLALDCGNTLVKASVLEDSNLTTYPFEYDKLEELTDWLESEDFSGIAMASVHGVNPRFVETIRHFAGDKFLLVTPQMEMPVKINYADPALLGIDRKLAVVGACKLYPDDATLIIDAGTALTKDLAVGNEGFAGGTISPGLRMRFAALNSGTHLLPEIDFNSESEIDTLGFSTERSIIAGVAGGMADEVIMMIARMAEKGVKRVLFCGGDGEWLMERIKKESKFDNIEIIYEPGLTAIGLREIYKHHEKEN